MADISLEKTLPNNTEAERSILGAVLLHQPALYEAGETLAKDDFYLEAHRIIWSAFLDLQKAESGIDFITVKNELQRSNKLEACGGAAYLASLTDGLPRAINVRYYTQIVREQASLRKLISLANESMARGYQAEESFTDICNDLQLALLKLSEGSRKKNIWMKAPELVKQAYAEIEQIAYRKTETIGLDTGFQDLNRMTQGFHRGDLVIIAGRPGHGKAQPLDSQVLTPSGFVKMGDLKIGDQITGSNGRAAEVIGIYAQGELDVYRVTLSDGSSCECSIDHLWFTQTRNEKRYGRSGSVKTLKEISDSLTRTDSEWKCPNHYLPVVQPVQFRPRPILSLAPYLVGLLLGDGMCQRSVLFCKPETDLQEELERLLPPGDAINHSGDDVRIVRKQRSREKSETAKALDCYGLLGCDSFTKFIPRGYLFALINDRVRLLQGLCDTDGHVTKEGTTVEYSTSSPQLAEDVTFLARSLGGVVRTATRIPTYKHQGETKNGSKAFRIFMRFTNGVIPVASKKNLARWRTTPGRSQRTIVKIDYVGKKQCQCIRVSAPDQLYVTDNFTVTHNSSLLKDIITTGIIRYGWRVGLFTIEMSGIEVIKRALFSESQVHSQRANTGFMNKEDWRRLSEAAGVLAETKLSIDESGGLTITELRSRAQSLAIDGGLDLIGVDYLQLMSGTSRRTDNHVNELSDITRGLQLLARDLNVPVIALSQLNRSIEADKTRKPILADLRESGSIEQDADVVLFIWREELRKATEENKGEADLIVGKQRNGPTGDIKLTFLPKITKFVDYTPQQTFSEI